MAEPNRILQEQRLSDQTILNNSFDDAHKILVVEIAAYDSATMDLVRVRADSQGRLILSPTATASILEFDEELTVAANSVTTILSYTNTGSLLYLDTLIATGEVDAEYRLVINGTTKMKYRTSEQNRTMNVPFPMSQLIQIGDIVDIKVIHYHTASTADFSANIIGHRA